MSAIAVVVVLVRRPTVQQSEFTAVDSTNHMVQGRGGNSNSKQEVKAIPSSKCHWSHAPPSKPSAELIGQGPRGARVAGVARRLKQPLVSRSRLWWRLEKVRPVNNESPPL